MTKRIIHSLLIVGALSLMVNAFLPGKVFAASDPFPIYECLEPNVAFWKKVYTQYSSKQGILHDSWNVSVIYEVIDLVDQQKPNARKENEARIKESKRKFEDILEKLAREECPSSAEENRIAALFGPTAVSQDFLAAKETLRCQTGQMDRFQEGLIRSGAFLKEIKEILESYGLPADLAYLPHVESSFNHNAYSKFGAAGIWQFMRSTGKRFMEIGYTIDERRDPIRSSHAAAKLLKESYDALGDWPTAITAYNHGLSGMLRAKRSLGGYEAIFRGYQSPLFKFASRNFYAEFLAARHVAKNYQQYFGELELKKPLKFREIVLTSYLPMSDLVHNSNLDAHVIRGLNPALREPVYKGQKYIPKGYSLRLPIGPGERPESVASELSQQIYQSEQKRSLFYAVQQGDTARDTASIHEIEFSQPASAADLDDKAAIDADQNLRIPESDEESESLVTATLMGDKAYSAVHAESVPVIIDGPDAKVEVEVPKENPSPAAQERIKVGELPTNPSIVTGDLFVQRVTTLNGRLIGAIRAEAEETIGHYADWLGVSSQAIRNLNGWKTARMLKLHEPVKIPLRRVSREAFEEKRFEYHKQLEEDFFGSYKIDHVKIYRIGGGDNIWALCKEVFEVPFWLVAKYNPGLDFNSLKPSRELFVPVVEGKG